MNNVFAMIQLSKRTAHSYLDLAIGAGDSEDGFGNTGSCSAGSCLVCSDDLDQPRCFVVEKDDSDNWVVASRLEKQLDPRDLSVGDSFGFEAVLRYGTAVITDSRFINIFEDVSSVNTQAPEIVEPEVGWLQSFCACDCKEQPA